ncbi:Thiol-disulfide oxidoreductase ResA [Candidatus Entotheonellaceae bacterium PAL068K]
MVQPSSHPSPDLTPQPASANQQHWGVTLLWLAPALFLLLVVIYGVLTRQAPPDDAAPRVGQPLADFTLPDLQGQPVQLSALRGRVVFLNVWATWCPPCVEEMPTIQRLYDQLHEHGLTVLTISLDALGVQVVAPFMRNYQLTFPALLDTQGIVERLYRTSGVPESFIVDKHGRLVEKIVGPRDWAHPRRLVMFERLLAAPGPGTRTE